MVYKIRKIKKNHNLILFANKNKKLTFDDVKENTKLSN